MTPTRCLFSDGRLAMGLVVALLLAAPARAQSEQTPSPTTLEVTQTPTPIAPVGQLPSQIEPPYWSTSSGFEGDSHGTGYGFFGPSYHKPFSPRAQLVAGVSAKYLYYGFDSSAGRTEVTSPGLSTKAGVRLGDRNWVQFTAGPGFSRKHRVVRDDTDRIISSDRNLEVGVNLGADLWVNPTRRSNIHGMLSYGADDGYTWGRIGAKQQVSNSDWRGRFTHYLGAEYIGQGNRDIRSSQVGPFIEFLHAPSTISVSLRGGYKHSSFALGPDRTGPWFAVSFYKAYGKQ